MENKRDWIAITFGTIWFLASLLILVLYLTGNLHNSFPIPRLLAILYDLLGIVPAAIIQMIFSLLIIVFNIRKK